MFKFATNSLSLSRIWGNSFKLYSFTLGKIWLVAFIMMLITGFPGLLAPKSQVAVNAQNAAANVTPPPTHVSALYVVLFIIALLITWYVSAVILHRMYNLASEPTSKLSTSAKFVLSKYLLIIVALAITSIISLAGLLVFVVPGVFVTILFLFTLPFILFDNAGCISAIKSSCKLVWGNWWRTFAVFLVPAMIIVIVELLIPGILKNVPAWINMIIDSLVLSILFPYIQAVILVQFNDLKLRQMPIPTESTNNPAA